MKRNRSHLIREFLKSNSERQLPAAIAEGIGMPGDIRVSWTLNVMLRDGHIDRVGPHRQAYRYGFVRDPIPPKRPEEVRAKRNAAAKRRRDAMPPKQKTPKGAPPAPKPAPVHPSRAAITAALDRMAKRDAAVAKDKAASKAPVNRVETIEEFMARGGKVEQLKPWDVSKPLRSHADLVAEADFAD